LRWVAESLEIPLIGPRPSQVESPMASGSSEAGTTSTPRAGAALDIKTFMENKKPKSDTHFVAATAYYYRFEAPTDEKKESINAEILQDAARLAGRARFVTPLVTLNNAKKQGYVDAAERGAFKINSVGENLVAMTLPGAAGSTPQKNRKSSKQRTAAKKN
jgi:hypothetical protein